MLVVGGWFSRLLSPYPEDDKYPKAGTIGEKATHIALQPLVSGIGLMGFLLVVAGTAIRLMVWAIGLAFAWYFISEIFGL
ncbi:MAG: hypothetical protein BGO23_08975 [Solirubrobacterales bacterium 67-14]|nr:MAG: hypothetical protein BGO23_08975 [Solirubrobacterales bacterium 67-14]